MQAADGPSSSTRTREGFGNADPIGSWRRDTPATSRGENGFPRRGNGADEDVFLVAANRAGRSAVILVRCIGIRSFRRRAPASPRCPVR
jgi:hypothetical protein